jgi:hypothetical protein
MSLMKESYRRERIAKLQRMTVRDGCSWGTQKAAMNEIWSLVNERFEPDHMPPPFDVVGYYQSLQANVQPNQRGMQQQGLPFPLSGLLAALGMGVPARGHL